MTMTMTVKRLLSVAVMVGMLTVMTVQVALAAQPEIESCALGAVDNSINGEWVLVDIDALTELYGGNAQAAERTFDFCDHNGDGLLCTTTQTLPNDANGSDTWYLSEDNLFGKSHLNPS